MAGARQQNTFLALMNDMAKGAENGSRYYELLALSMDSAGAAQEKYAIYMESVTAAQDDYKNSLENLYSMVMNADMLKGFYNSATDIIDVFAKGIEVTDGWTLKIPALVLGFIALTGAVMGTVKAVRLLSVGSMTLGGFGAIAAGVGIVATLATTISGAIATANQTRPFKEIADEMAALERNFVANQNRVKELRDEYISLTSTSNLTAEQQERLKVVYGEISKLSPTLRATIRGATGDFDEQKTVVGTLNKEIERLQRNYDNDLRIGALDLFKSGIKEIDNAQKLMDIIERYFEHLEKYPQLLDRSISSFDAISELSLDQQNEIFDIMDEIASVLNISRPFDRKGSLNNKITEFMDEVNLVIDAKFTQLNDNIIEKTSELNKTLMAFSRGEGYYALSSSVQSSIQRMAQAYVDSFDLTQLDSSGFIRITDGLKGMFAKAMENADLAKTTFEGLFSMGTQFAKNLPDSEPIRTGIENWIGEAISSIDLTGDVEEQGKKLEAAFKQLFENDEFMEKIKEVNELLKIDTALFTEEQLKKWRDQVKEAISILNELVPSDMGEIKIPFPTQQEEPPGTDNMYKKYYDAAKKIISAMEAGKAAVNGFRDQIYQLQAALGNGSLLELWASMTDDMRSGMEKAYPELAQIIVAFEDGEMSAAEMAEAVRILAEMLGKANETAKQADFSRYKDASGTISSINDALEKLGDKKKSKDFGIGDLDSLIDQYPQLLLMMQDQAALEEYLIELKGEQAKTQAEAYNSMLMNSESFFSYLKATNHELYQLLSDLYGQDAANFQSLANAKAKIEEFLISQLGAAWRQHFSDMASAMAAIASAAKGKIADIQAERQALRDTTRTSTSQAGMGDYMRQLAEREAEANATYEQLEAYMEIANAFDNISVALGNVDFSAPKISAGGGGGGGSNRELEKTVDLLQQMLDLMNQLDAIRDFDREMNKLNQTYYKNRGEISNYIEAMRDELTLIERDTAVVRENVRVLEEQMNAKKAEIAGTKYGTEEYDKANEALDKLQKQHMQYSKQLLQNKIDVDALNEAIKEQERAMRQLQIDIRNIIEKAIRDREALYESMLKAEISMENEILSLLTKRYEKERDMILENINERIKALKAEKQAIDDNLRKRKEEQDWADKEAKLRSMEAQLSRVMADPTRAREAEELRAQIASLRNEMAWDTAEQEAKAQKNSIDQQITSLEGYAEYVKKLYDDLFKHPEKLIAEMRQIIQQTDDQIIAWLKKSSDDYAASSARTQESMVRNWQSTLYDMRGHIETYWDEVESIIVQGDAAIIEFLKAHSADYRAAGALQAEAYVDEWQRKLDALRAAARQTYEAIQSYSYTPTQTGTNTGSGSGGNGSGGGGGGGTSAPRFVKSGTGYAEAYKSTATTFTHDGDVFVKDPKSDYWYRQTDAKSIDGGRTYYWATGSDRYIKKYAMGGLIDYTGPAMVHGSKINPEAVLNPAQTKTFQSFVKAMEKMVSVNVGGIIGSIPQPKARDAGAMSFGDIIVRVDKLENNDDAKRIAQMVKREIAAEMRRGRAVGGIFFGRG